MSDGPFHEEPADTREAIMQATYDALRAHGYADLTIQRIGDRFEKSKSLLYHHYDSKDELLLDFLQFMLDEFEGTVRDDAATGPAARLDSILDVLLADDLPAERTEFQEGMIELRAQATTQDRYRESFTRHEAFFRERLREIVAEGIERGEFRNVDPDSVADFLLTTITGVMHRRATTELEDFADVRTELDAYVDARLLAADATAADNEGDAQSEDADG